MKYKNGLQNSSDLMAQIRNKMPTMASAQKKAAALLLRRPYSIIGMGLDELAAEAGVSRHSVLRMVKTLGFSGLKEMQYALGRMYQAKADENSDPMLLWLFHSSIEALVDTVNHIDAESLEQAVSICSCADSLFFYGMGESGLMAETMHHRSLLLGMESTLWPPGFPHIGTFVDTRSAVIIISRSGQAQHIREFFWSVKEQGAPVMAVTTEPQSWLVDHADVVLFAMAPALQSPEHIFGIKTGYEILLNTVLFKAAARKGVELCGVGERLNRQTRGG